MTPFAPITLSPPQLGSVASGRCTALRKPAGGALERALTRSHQPVRQLWIREPFYLPRLHGGMRPLEAVALGAKPIFPEDAAGADVGPRCIAYTLPRAWHRRHLWVLGFERQRLQAITDAEIRDEGWEGREAYAEAWDRTLMVGGSVASNPVRWAANPEVLVVRFEHIFSPIKGAL